MPIPLYTEATDRGFIAACEELLVNRAVRDQMGEEEVWARYGIDEPSDGFFTIYGQSPLSLGTSIAAPITSWVIPEAVVNSRCMIKPLETEQTEETETSSLFISVASCSINPWHVFALTVG